jgi:N-acetylmuramoyl-L-alanine amidase
MGEYHTVAQGEFLSLIASKYGFADYKTIWEAGENQSLKEERKNPSVLFPGDKVFIPDKELREESGSTESKHRFELRRHKLLLRLKLEGLKKEPLKDHECVLTVEGDTEQFTTGADGIIKKEISASAGQGQLKDRDKAGSAIRTETTIPLKIGSLDPETKITGQIARLNNLGYNAGEIPDHPLYPDEEKALRESPDFISAVEEFQCDFMGGDNLAQIKAVVDGICGKKTQAKLVEAHGC